MLITEEEVIFELIEGNNKDDGREGNTKKETKRMHNKKEGNTKVHNDKEYDFIVENVELDEQKQDMSIHKEKNGK